MKKIMIVAGARPNFMKIAPLLKEFGNYKDQFHVMLIHTGQHYDFEMSESFFQDLEIPVPCVHLEIGSETHAVQTANIMTAFETLLHKERPELVVVVGDVNSTLACSLVATKMNIKVAHVEAGLRSFDRTMPEEINRIVTDSISDYLFVSEETGCVNLEKEGVNRGKVHFVGNVMIDTLLSNMPKIDKSSILKTHSLQPKNYAVLTLHRPANVDTRESLLEIYEILKTTAGRIKIVYPVHPRTKKMMERHALLESFAGLDNFLMVNPLGYIDFLHLVKNSKFVLTDSGGIQEETTLLKVPCLTMRENTERPVTINEGTNILVGRNKSKVLEIVDTVLARHVNGSKVPQFWDGKTARRIVKILSRQFQGNQN
jgi:UDP-N-acetylglucosamine 2-epimerase (non-hydrolysing)